MKCRSECGACCIAPSISQAYFGMPQGKQAGEACIHLDVKTKKCAIWNTPNYPHFCRAFVAEEFVCGTTREEALQLLTFLEETT